MIQRKIRMGERLDRMLSAGLDSRTDPELLWRVRTIAGGAFLFLALQLLWVLITLIYLHSPFVSFIFFGLTVSTAILLIILNKYPKAVIPIGHCVMALVFIAIVIPNYLTGGTYGANLGTFLLLPFASVLLVGPQSLPWFIVSAVVTIGMFVLSEHGYPFPQMIPSESRFLDSVVTLVIVWSGISFTLLYSERIRRQTSEEARRQREAALAAAEAKSAFLANVSHEIRTPLGGIIGMNRLLLETGLDEEQRDYARSLHSCANSLLEIVDDVLDLSKMEAGRLDLVEAPFDLSTAAEEACSAIAVRAHEKGLELVCDVAPRAVRRVMGDRIRLEQVLRNLVGNAVKFTREGQVVLRVDVEMVKAGWATVRFTVTDTGIGIPEDAKERIFESFTQVDASTTRQYGGTGLGLRIARDLVSKMGGLMGLESTPGKGSTFWFTAVLRLCSDGDHANESAHRKIRGRRTLIVEDNADAGRAVQRALQEIGLEASLVSSVNEAIDKLLKPTLGNALPYHFCFIDAQLKDENGAPATVQIRKVLPETPPVILLAPAGARRLSGEWRPVEAVAVVSKPLRRSELVETLLRVNEGVERTSDHPEDGAEQSFGKEKPGGRVLVVEDEPISRKTLVRTLEKLGLEVISATNGTEAVEVLSQREVDLVFMDVQMPEMDGLEATRIVRSRDSSVLQDNVPIVAVTAHAFPQSREACLEAGMNSVITKPIRSGVLRAMLERYLGLALRSSPPSLNIQVGLNPTPSSPALNPAILLEKLGGEPAYALEVLDLWFRDVPARISALERALTENDIEAVQAAAHTLKGGAANAGAEVFRRTAEAIDLAARQGDLEPARQFAPKLRLALSDVEKAAREAFGQMNEKKNN